MLTDLNNRGLQDILIACVDGLTGFPEAINAIFPQTEVQLCVIHQIRNSLKYVASKNQKEFMADLKPVYKAETVKAAEIALDALEEKWGTKYPIVIKSWRKKWPNLSVYFKYPADIRRVIYTTNAIEAVHRQFRKLTKTKGAFPNDPGPAQTILGQAVLGPWNFSTTSGNVIEARFERHSKRKYRQAREWFVQISRLTLANWANLHHQRISEAVHRQFRKLQHPMKTVCSNCCIWGSRTLQKNGPCHCKTGI